MKAVFFPPLFCSVFALWTSKFEVTVSTISPEDSTLLLYGNKKKRNNYFTWIVSIRFLSATDIDHMLQRLLDTFFFFVCSYVVSWLSLLQVGREDKIYLWRSEGGKASYARFTSFAQLNTKDGLHAGQFWRKKKKLSVTLGHHWTNGDSGSNGDEETLTSVNAQRMHLKHLV